MNPTTVAGIIRAILAALAGYLAGKGIDIAPLISPEATGAIGVLVVAAWSIWSKKTPPPAAS